MKSTRESFGESLLDLGSRYENILVVSADLCGATKTKAFGKQYPERFFECGIAESNAVSIASGLALSGYRPFFSTFGAFMEVATNQIANSICYNRAPVVLVGTHAGLAIGKDGATQMGTRDLAIMRAMQGLEIYQPADEIETKAIMEHLATSNSPAYLRLCRQPMLEVNKENYRFIPGRTVTLRQGNDIAVYAQGGTIATALEAAKELEEKHKISTKVINVPSIHPFDGASVGKVAREYDQIVTIEDHRVIGGLGDMVASAIVENDGRAALTKIGLPKDFFGESGNPNDLYKKYGLDKDNLVDTVLKVLEA